MLEGCPQRYLDQHSEQSISDRNSYVPTFRSLAPARVVLVVGRQTLSSTLRLAPGTLAARAKGLTAVSAGRLRCQRQWWALASSTRYLGSQESGVGGIEE